MSPSRQTRPRPPAPQASSSTYLVQSDFWANQRAIIESLADKGALRPDLDIQHATDLLWTLNHPDLWLLLVDRRGWSPEQWEAWFLQSCRQQLLA